MKNTTPDDSLFQVFTEGFIPEIKKSEDEDEDAALLKKHGFDKALARLNGEEPEEDEDEDEADSFCPSQRGYGAVAEEYSRMGVSFED